MESLPIFLSLVLIERNNAAGLAAMVSDVAAKIRDLVSDYELIVVDNASSDGSLNVLKCLVGEDGEPNLQVYALTDEVDQDTAAWVGVENALGDFVAVYDPQSDDLEVLPLMLERAAKGADLVLASNERPPRVPWAYGVANWVFSALYKWLNGVDLRRDAPRYRVLSRRVINFVMQHRQPAVAFRHLGSTAGFARAHLTFTGPQVSMRAPPLGEAIDRGVRLLVSTTRAPMRLVTSFSLFGALANVLYSAYVVSIALFKTNVAEGWVSLSLQQSGMFLLISLVLLVLGEYILHMTSLSSGGPLYHVAQEMTSAQVTRRERLNVEIPKESGTASAGD